MITIQLTVHHLAGQERLPFVPRHYGKDPVVVRRVLSDRPQDTPRKQDYGSLAKCGHSRHGSYLQCSESDCPKYWAKHTGAVEDYF